MSDSPTDKGVHPGHTDERSGQRLVYVLQESVITPRDLKEVSLRDVWNILWRGKWTIISLTSLFAVASVFYALAASEWYRAEVLLAPAEARSTPSFGGQLSGLAALAGVSVGGGETAEAVATLKSRELARDFIDANSLIHVILHEAWDESSQTWKADGGSDLPDIRDAVESFHDRILKVRQDRESGLVSVAMEWTDPSVVASWANDFVRFANDRIRRRALEQAEANVAYLRDELAATSVVTLQQSVGRLLETEMQKLMLARGNEEFAFRTVDVAEVPKKRIRPRRTMMVVIGTLLGGMCSVMLVLVLHGSRSKQRS